MQDFELENQLAQQRYQQALAEQQKSFSSPQGKMVGNIYVRSNPLEGLIQGLRMKQSKDELGAARQELKDLRGKRQETETKDMSAFVSALRGTPAQASTTTPTQMPSFDEADAQSMQGVQGYGATTGAQAAIPGDPMAAYSLAAASQSPTLRQVGMKGIADTSQRQADLARQQQQLQVLKNAENPQAAITAGVDPALVKNYYESQNIGKEKGVVVNGQLVNPVTGAPIGQAIPKQATPIQPNLASDLLIPDGKGGFIPNAALINAKSQVAAAGRAPGAPRQAQIIQTEQGPMQLVGGQAVPIMGPGGVPVKAKAGPEKEPTEGERKAGTLLTRLRGSQAQLDEVTRKNPSAASPNVLGQALSGIGMESAGNLLTSSDRQRVNAAQLDLLDSALTLGTGAAYTREQLEGYRKSFFPQIGDSAATIKDKQDRLNNVIKSAEVAAGRAEPQSTPKFGPGAQNQRAPVANPQDAEALQWARSNPNDPRSRAILQRLGQ